MGRGSLLSLWCSLFHPRAIWEMHFGKSELYQTLLRESTLMVKGSEKFWPEIAWSVYFSLDQWLTAPFFTWISSPDVFITELHSPIGLEQGGSMVCFFITYLYECVCVCFYTHLIFVLKHKPCCPFLYPLPYQEMGTFVYFKRMPYGNWCSGWTPLLASFSFTFSRFLVLSC